MKWSLKCGDAEQIGLEHIARISADANSEQLSPKGKHLKSQINSVEMLMTRMKLLVQYLAAAKSGELPKNPEILLELKKLCERIRLLIAAERDDKGQKQIDDYKTAALLCNVVEIAGMLGDAIQKTNIIAAEHGTGMNMSLRPGMPPGFGKASKFGHSFGPTMF
uniref:MitMem_reg domain-containing protein n=1 Tax=Steinernema glaseri TaxID=37863 RepID=A0A1I8AFK5_9BILA